MKERAQLLEEERLLNDIPRFYNTLPPAQEFEEIEVIEEEVDDNMIGEEVNNHLLNNFYDYKILIEDIINNHSEFLNEDFLNKGLLTEGRYGVKPPKIKIEPIMPKPKRGPRGSRSFKRAALFHQEFRSKTPKQLINKGNMEGGKYVNTLLAGLIDGRYRGKYLVDGVEVNRSGLGRWWSQVVSPHTWGTNYNTQNAKLIAFFKRTSKY